MSTLAGVGIVSAQSGTADSTDPMSSLVQKIATKFNLNQDDVQKVFDEEKQERDAKRDEQQSEHLQKLVNEGTITSTQKTAIEAKLKELKAERESDKDSMQNLSESERRAKMDEKRTTLETWAKEQGIDLTKLHGIFMGGRGHHGPGGPQ